MGMQVNNQTQTPQAEQLLQVANDLLTLVSKTCTGNPAGVPNVSSSFDIDELPTLPAPAGPLSLDTLLTAIGNETRKQACRDGVNSIELKGEQQAEINQKELDELKKQLESLAKKSVADGFLKAFSIIGAIIGAVASVASIAVGAATGNACSSRRASPA